MAKSQMTIVDDLDMEISVDEIDMSPEYVDMSPGSYYLRVAGFTKKATEIEDPETGDQLPTTRRGIVFQIVGIKAAEAPQPEVGGIFSQGGIMAYQIARDQFIRLTKKVVKAGDKDFDTGGPMSDTCNRAIELFDRDAFLLCTITVRDEKYPNIRSMVAVNTEEVEDFDPDTFQFAEFEFVA